MKLLVTGAQGRLGSQLVNQLEQQHTVTGIDVDDADITVRGHVFASFDRTQPDLVLHCAALTDVDYCAEHPEQALVTNAFGTQNIALACQKYNSTLLYVSTNEVFSGNAHSEQLEYDRPDPANPYGYSKWVGEQIVRELVSKHYIVRTSWLFAHGGNNFVQTILACAEADRPLRVVTNEVSSPTYNDDLVSGIEQLIGTDQYGTYHLVNEGYASRYAFARYILDRTGYQAKPIEPIALAEFKRASRPPEYATLRNMAAARLGITLRPWQEAVDAFLQTEGFLKA